ncbi:MAG: biopolymer transporter ExbD [Ferruginibacter sp.]|nr:biopolymer transporter ExbD [Ferruginibacter sp.]
MPKVKIPRKSTAVDMTAMCDVAFLLLSFFILATKQKPPEVLAVSVPSSVSTKVASDKAILITLTKDGRTFLMLGEDAKKAEVLANINEVKGLGLTPAELTKWGKQQFIGTPLNMVKGTLALATEPNAALAPGIPIDSANNEMADWVRSIANVFAAASVDQKDLEKILLIKGDGEALYPKFKMIKEALKKNEIFKFQIVTNGTPAPIGSELYIENKLGVKQD